MPPPTTVGLVEPDPYIRHPAGQYELTGPVHIRYQPLPYFGLVTTFLPNCAYTTALLNRSAPKVKIARIAVKTVILRIIPEIVH
jgi:hypothetical protein